MAKVTGPLMSMEASGKFADSLVFGKRKGKNVVRSFSIPSNPQTQGQMDIRNFMKLGGAMQVVCGALTVKRSGETKTDKALLTAKAPSDQTWNSFVVQKLIGNGGDNIIAGKAAYSALSAPQKTAWADAAAALPYPFTAVGQVDAGGVVGTPVVAGEVYFLYVYALFKAGVADSPTGTPPTYA